MIRVSDQKRSKRLEYVKKKSVIITSRVHPGETNASFVFSGFFNFIISPEAKKLRELYTFYLVPCLNPDGVECGNYRTSSTGFDLNRQWLNPHQKLHPIIYELKSFLRQLKEISLFCDLHGHSTKRNSFIYGCPTAAKEG